VNREAGTHAVTADPAALEAVDQASEASRRRFPYLDARYGARGRAFTRSDGGWLVALAEQPERRVRDQIAWLAGVLAARGLPRLVLEEHLRALAEALRARLPERADRWARLEAAGRALAAERTARVSAAAAGALAATLDAARPLATTPPPPDAPELLASALADERAGLPRAIPTLCDWLADPARFGDRWQAAVTRALEAARAVG
jgi:hypothetical protein